MNLFHDARTRFFSGLVVSGALALVALQPLGAHAAAIPLISATAVGRTTIQVSGAGFGPGDRVEVVDSVGGRVFTTASRFIVPFPRPPKCLPTRPCTLFIPSIGGRINVTLPPHVVHCVVQLVTVRARDLTTHTFSNTVRVLLGSGLCR